VGFGGSGGRLVELGERERGAQTPTAGALLFRDGDGALERFLRGGGAGGVAPEQDFAAETMHEDEIGALPDLLGESQCLVDARERAVSSVGLQLEFGEQRFGEPAAPHALLGQGLGGRWVVKPASRPNEV
jgi:hypothetical protein